MSLPPPLGALEMTVEAGDGLILKGGLTYPELPVGGKFPLAVLAHQYPATADSFATPLGFTAEAFGAAFVSSAAKVGFNRIADDVLRLASWGAVQGLKALLIFGAAGEQDWGPDGREQGRQAMTRIRSAALHASSEADPFAAASNARTWSEGLAHARAVIVPGAEHAMAIYYDVRAEAIGFLRRALGS